MKLFHYLDEFVNPYGFLSVVFCVMGVIGISIIYLYASAISAVLDTSLQLCVNSD